MAAVCKAQLEAPSGLTLELEATDTHGLVRAPRLVLQDRSQSASLTDLCVGPPEAILTLQTRHARPGSVLLGPGAVRSACSWYCNSPSTFSLSSTGMVLSSGNFRVRLDAPADCAWALTLNDSESVSALGSAVFVRSFQAGDRLGLRVLGLEQSGCVSVVLDLRRLAADCPLLCETFLIGENDNDHDLGDVVMSDKAPSDRVVSDAAYWGPASK